MSRNRRRNMTLVAIAVLVLGALTIGITLYAQNFNTRYSPTAPMHNHKLGKSVWVTGSKVPTLIEAKSTTSRPPLKNITELSPAMDIKPSGKLQAPMTLRFKLTKRPPAGRTVFIATREPLSSTWTYLTPTISADGQYARCRRRTCRSGTCSCSATSRSRRHWSGSASWTKSSRTT